MLLIACGALSVTSIAQDSTPSVNLGGVPAPFSFEGYCKPNENEFWIAGGQGFVSYLTADGGSRDYDLSRKTLYNGDLEGLYFNGSGVGWVVGSDGVIFHTSDYGNNWALQASGIKSRLFAVACVDDAHCWVVGDSGTILRTVNGGKRWAIMNSSVEDDIKAVAFVNQKEGWVVGEDGLILSTSDGGETWHESRLEDSPGEGPRDLRAVTFLNENIGWVLGYETIARTTNGGRTWVITFENDRTHLVGIVSNDGNRVYAANRGDNNYCSDDSGKTWKTCFARK